MATMPPFRPQNNNGETTLGPDFRPGQYDVICHRGKDAYNHNHHFRQLIADHVELYSQCQTKVDTSVLVISLVDVIRELSPLGGFVKICNKKKCYVEIGDRGARQKVAHALRNAALEGSDEKQRSSVISKSKKTGDES